MPNQCLSRRDLILTSLSLPGLALLPACGRSSKPAGNTLIYAQPEDPKTLDPINTDIAEAVHVITNLFDTLVTYDEETTEIVPSLAEKWEHTPDGLTWTFHLRRGVIFHDKTPVTSEAVKVTFERLILPKHPYVFDTARPYASSYSMIKAIETPDEHTAVLHLHHASAILLSNLAMFPASIVSPTGLKQHGEDFAEHPVGSGPFEFVKWSRNQQLVCKAFDRHFLGKPKVENLVWVPVKENATRVERLARGEVHVSENLTPVEMDQLARNPRLVIQESPGMNVAYLAMQTEKPPLDNLKVREAIWLAIDKSALIKIGYGGHAEPAVTMVPPAMWGHHRGLVDRKYDVAQAKQLMEEAAAEAGFSLPLRLSLSMMNQARPYLQQPVAIAGYMKDALSQIGIEVTISQRDVNQHFEHLMAGRHELGLAGWNSDNSDPDNFLYTLLDPDNISESGNNLSRWRNDEFHELMLAGQRELDTEKRLQIYLKAQEIVFRECPVVPLVHTQLRAAHAKSLRGFNLHPTGLIRLRTAHFEEQP